MNNDKYWFRKKSNGWGFHEPLTWQGWLWMDLFLLVTAGDILWLLTTPHHLLVAFIKFLIVLIIDVAVFRYVTTKKSQPQR